MKRIGKHEQQRVLELERELLSAGYVSVIQSTPKSQPYCDLVAYAAAEGGGIIGIVVEIATGKIIDFELAALRLDLARSKSGVSGALLVSEGAYFSLAPNGKDFLRLDQIPKVTSSASPIRDDNMVTNLISKSLNEVRGQIDPSDYLDYLLARFDASEGKVLSPDGNIGIDGEAFRKAVSKFLGRQSAKTINPFFASEEIQFLFSRLGQLFPRARSIFDPFFGLGLSPFAVADHLQKMSNDPKGSYEIAGFDNSDRDIVRARKLGMTVANLASLELEIGSGSEGDWPVADLLISEPPLGLRLTTPIQLLGVNLRFIEHQTVLKAAIGVNEGAIREGAILLTGRSWIQREDTQSLRDKLVDLGVVRAVLGLPGLKANTSLPLVAIVMARGAKDSLVGELFDDWQELISDENGGLHELLRK